MGKYNYVTVFGLWPVHVYGKKACVCGVKNLTFDDGCVFGTQFTNLDILYLWGDLFLCAVHVCGH